MSTGISTNTGYHNRRSIRLRGYDYSRPGAYFLTLCVHNHAQIVFGEIVAEVSGTSPRITLNEYGQIANTWISAISKRFESAVIESYVIMPDHVHMIIDIRNADAPLNRAVGAIHGHNVGAIHGHNVGAIHGHNVGAIHGHNVGAIHGHNVGAIHELPLQNNAPDYNENIRRQRRMMTIPKIVGFYRMNVAKCINDFRNTPGAPVWQRNYHDHIIRDDTSRYRISQYIRDNPANWFADAGNHRENETEDLHSDERK